MRRIASVIVGLLSVGMGGFYLYFPVIEMEARQWGVLSIIGGLAVLATLLFVKPGTLLRISMVVGFSILALAQGLPIFAWLAFPMFTDSPDGSISWTDRLWLLPHGLIIVGCAVVIIELMRHNRVKS